MISPYHTYILEQIEWQSVKEGYPPLPLSLNRILVPFVRTIVHWYKPDHRRTCLVLR